MTNSSSVLRGIVPPLVTPLLPSGQLDQAGLDRLIAHVLAGGVHGLFMLGTSGEGPSLPSSVQLEVVARTCRAVAGRVPVLVSVSHTVLEEAVTLARASFDYGATAAVVAPPYYVPPSQDELWEWFRRFDERLKRPFYVYNLPSITKVSIGESVIARCLSLENFRGLKDSSGDLHYFKRMQRLLGATKRHSLFIGPEELLAESLLAGGDGGVSGGANVWPKLYVDLFLEAQRANWAEVSRLQATILDISTQIYSLVTPISTVTQPLKLALAELEICGATLTLPQLPWKEADVSALRAAMRALRLDEHFGHNPAALTHAVHG